VAAETKPQAHARVRTSEERAKVLTHQSGREPYTMFTDFKYEFIRTPLERPLMWLRRIMEYPARWRHPELRDIFLEEKRIHAVLKEFIEPTCNCLDIGCHYGSMLSAFCRLSPEGRHVAFEAIPRKVQFLRRKFPEVDVRETALSDRSGFAEFFVNRDATACSGLAPLGEGHFDRIRVASARLDDVVPRDRKFGFVKIDVAEWECAGQRLSVRGGACLSIQGLQLGCFAS